MEAARLGQLSAVRMLLDSGTATVEDRDNVSVCVRVYIYYATSKQQYMALIVLIIHHTLLVFVHVVLVLAYTVEIVGFHSHACIPAYLQYIYVAMTTVGSEWHT